VIALLLLLLQDRVVIVSVDGMRPDHYLADGWEMPTLRKWVEAGAHAKGAESVFPSVTYPAHATIVTGVRPAKHGVVANGRFGESGAMREWHWEAKEIKARTLWQAAREKGLKTAIVLWPSSVGADVDWRVAERWAVDKTENTAELLAKHSTKGLLGELALAIGVPPKGADSREGMDKFISEAAAYVLRKYKPQLAFVHLGEVDHFSHREGPDSERVKRAVKETDEHLARIRKGAGEDALMIVTGDHGFTEVSESVAPNVLLAEAGFIEIEEGKLKSWKAMVHAYGGSAAAYVKEGTDAAAVAKVLEKGRKGYVLVDRRALDELGGNAAAAFALEAEDGFQIAGALTGAFTGKATVKGQHGQLPWRAKLMTGFVAVGPGAKAGASVEKIRLIDIAPTVAKVLNLDMKDVEGRVLSEVLK